MSGGSLGRRVAAIGRRVRADYGGKDRAAEYRTLLETARDAGYALVSLGAFRAARRRRCRRAGRPDPRAAPRHRRRRRRRQRGVPRRRDRRRCDGDLLPPARHCPGPRRVRRTPPRRRLRGGLPLRGGRDPGQADPRPRPRRRRRPAGRGRSRLPRERRPVPDALRPGPPLGREPRRLDEPRPRVPQQRVRDAGAADGLRPRLRGLRRLGPRPGGRLRERRGDTAGRCGPTASGWSRRSPPDRPAS